MPRLTADQWETVRAEREAGASFRNLAERHGISHVSIMRKAHREEWGDGTDVVAVVRKKATEQATGVTSANPKKKAEEIDAAARRTAAVVERHKREWDDHMILIDNAIAAKDFEAAKLAKITSETIRIRQDGERKAWGLDNQEIKIDVTKASDAELEALVKGKL